MYKKLRSDEHCFEFKATLMFINEYNFSYWKVIFILCKKKIYALAQLFLEKGSFHPLYKIYALAQYVKERKGSTTI